MGVSAMLALVSAAVAALWIRSSASARTGTR
jgi:hypothetical protein